MPPILALLAVLAAAAPGLDLAATAVDPDATAAGLRARVGPALDGWTISVRDTGAGHEVEATLRTPDGRRERRRLTLTGATRDDRSRELATSLALLVEADEPPPTVAPKPKPKPPAEPPPPAARTRGWLGLGPRLEVGVPPAGGLDVAGGAWLVREHLQPLGNLAWSATAADGLQVHTLRVGGGLAAGSALAGGRIWLGGHVLLQARWVQARGARTASTWTGASEVGGLLQFRWTRALLGVRTGIDLNFPAVRISGDAAQLTRGPVGWVLAVNLGFVFG